MTPLEPAIPRGRGLDRLEIGILVAVTVLVLLPIYAFTASWDIVQSNDPRSAALAGWTFATTGDLAFDDRWESHVTSWPVEGRGGDTYSNRFPGIIAVAAIAYAVPVALGLVPAEPVAHPYQVPVWPATLAAVLVAALAAALTYRLFRGTDVSRGAAIVAGALVAVGSPLWSVSASALWTHGPTHALLVGVLLALLGGRQVLAAVLASVAVTFRPHLVVPLLVLAAGQRTWRGRLSLGAGGIAGLLLVASYSYWIFEQPLPAAGYPVAHLMVEPRILSPVGLASNVLDWLIDPRRGALVYMPILLLAAPGMPVAWRSAPRWVRVAALAGAAYAFTQLGLIRASGGVFFFGHRTTIEALVLASPLLLLSIHRLFAAGSLARIAIGVTVGYSIVLHAFGAWIDMPRVAREDMREHQERMAPASAPVGLDARNPLFHLATDLQIPRGQEAPQRDALRGAVPVSN